MFDIKKKAEKKNTIVFVTSSMGRGGAERVVSILADRYVKKGWEVHILMLLHNITSGYALNKEIIVEDLSFKRLSPVAAIPFAAVRLRRRIKELDPDAAVCFTAQCAIICGPAFHGLKTPMIAAECSDPVMTKRNIVFRRCLNRVYSKCNCTIQQTKRAMNSFPESVRCNSIIVPNPVSVACTASENRSKRIVAAGRLVPVKNHEMLINAFYDFNKQMDGYTLEIYGGGPKKQQLFEQINKLALENSVLLRGSSSTLHRDISDAAMFVMSSNYEGLSNAMLEAMLMGLPIISTDCAGADEYIVNKENGLLVPVGDRKAMTEAMLFMARNPQKAGEFGRAARISVQDICSTNSVMSQWERVIEGEELPEKRKNHGK